MNINFLHSAVAESLGWTLLHFTWQGTALAILLKLALGWLRRASAQARYLAGCGALVAAALFPLVTFATLQQLHPAFDLRAAPGAQARADQVPTDGVRSTSPNVLARVTVQRRPQLVEISTWLEARLPSLLLVWAGGVLLCSLRLAAGWCQVRRLAREGKPLRQPEWQDRLRRAAQRLRLTRSVTLAQSALVRVPTALGWLRPVILLPMTGLTGLVPAEVEAILAHELAHVRRHDYLVNLLQSLVETLLFYHPAVWWISGQVRTEREHACDDLVVAAYGDRIGYARALANLEELCSGGCDQLALAATGGSLLERVQRLLGKPAQHPSSAGWIVSLAVPAAFAFCLLAERNVPAAWSSPPATATIVGQELASPKPSSVAKPPDPEPSQVEEEESAPSEGAPESAKAVAAPAPKFYTRSYKVNPNTFMSGIRKALLRHGEHEDSPILPLASADEVTAAPGNLSPAGLVREYFREAGFDAGEPVLGTAAPSFNESRRALFYDTQKGLLLVRATPDELDRVEKAVQLVNVLPPQVMIETKFTELSQADMKATGLSWILGGVPSDTATDSEALQITNRNGVISQPALDGKGNLLGDLFDNSGLRNVEQVSPGIARTLSAAQFRVVIRALEQRSRADVLAAPRVTTLSGLQAKIEVIELKQVVTGVSITTDSQNRNKVNYIPSPVPLGPAVDLIPTVSADGKMIRLRVIPTWTEFLGYDKPTPFVVQGSRAGKRLEPLEIQRPLPHLQVRQTLANVNVHDGETIVISGFGKPPTRPNRGKSFQANPGSDRQLIIFVTPVIVDPAGNRVNPE